MPLENQTIQEYTINLSLFFRFIELIAMSLYTERERETDGQTELETDTERHRETERATERELSLIHI